MRRKKEVQGAFPLVLLWGTEGAGKSGTERLHGRWNLSEKRRIGVEGYSASVGLGDSY